MTYSERERELTFAKKLSHCGAQHIIHMTRVSKTTRSNKSEVEIWQIFHLFSEKKHPQTTSGR